jgi:hypothetical protein
MKCRASTDGFGQWKTSLHAPNEDEWIWWVHTHICGGVGKDILYREDPRDFMNLDRYEFADYVCYPTSYIVKVFMEGLESHRLTFTGRDTTKKYPESLREELEEDKVYLNLLLSDLHNARKIRLEFPPSIDDITMAFLHDKASESKRTPV